jgi:hypothetical protein
MDENPSRVMTNLLLEMFHVASMLFEVGDAWLPLLALHHYRPPITVEEENIEAPTIAENTRAYFLVRVWYQPVFEMVWVGSDVIRKCIFVSEVG